MLVLLPKVKEKQILPLNVIVNSLGSKKNGICYIQKSQSFECTICILASLMYSQWVMFAKELSTIIPIIKGSPKATHVLPKKEKKKCKKWKGNNKFKIKYFYQMESECLKALDL